MVRRIDSYAPIKGSNHEVSYRTKISKNKNCRGENDFTSPLPDIET